jgi:putative aminopeptidase FrvX
VDPTAAEYTTSVGEGPMIACSDALSVYDKDVAHRLMGIATERGLSPQAAVLGAFESDASHAKAGGLSPPAGLLCLPTLSTHGYEVIAREAIAAMADVPGRVPAALRVEPGIRSADVAWPLGSGFGAGRDRWRRGRSRR